MMGSALLTTLRLCCRYYIEAMGTELTGAQIEEVDDATTDGTSPVGTSTVASEREQHSTDATTDGASPVGTSTAASKSEQHSTLTDRFCYL